jgi:hypothetical protein
MRIRNVDDLGGVFARPTYIAAAFLYIFFQDRYVFLAPYLFFLSFCALYIVWGLYWLIERLSDPPKDTGHNPHSDQPVANNGYPPANNPPHTYGEKNKNHQPEER